MKEPRLSLILCSRNDHYMGNPVWRLQSTLNYVAAQAAQLGRQSDIEILVADWGSDAPLHQAVTLSPEAAAMTKFIEIPTLLTKTLQKDSPFSEVYALNAAIRQAKGQYIGRIDQDTLVGRGFLTWFFDALEGRRVLAVPLDQAIMLSGRRGVAYRFSARCPDFRAVTRLVSWIGRWLPLTNPLPDERYYQSAVGVLLMHRSLWHVCRGYDETFIYLDYMEFDLILRLMKQYQFVNLGRLVNHDFYHLDHIHSLAAWGAGGRRRKRNPMRDKDNPPSVFAPNGETWGLEDHTLPVLAVQESSGRWEAAGGSGRGRTLPGFIALILISLVGMLIDQVILGVIAVLMVVPRWLVSRSPGLKQRADAARNTVRQQPLYRWPGLLIAHWKSGRSAARGTGTPSSPVRR